MEIRKSLLLLQHQAIIFLACEGGRKGFRVSERTWNLADPIEVGFFFSVKESLKEIPLRRRWNVLPSPPFHFWWTTARPPVRLPESLNSITLDISPSAAVAQSREEDLTSESVRGSRVRGSLPPSPSLS